MLFTSDRVSVRKLQPEDAQWLHRWLNDDRVLTYYEGRDRPHTFQMIEDRFLSNQGGSITRCCVLFDGNPVGYIQYYPIDEGERRLYGYDEGEVAYAIDQFIGEPSLWNRGLGTQLVSGMVRYLFDWCDVTRVVLDPQVSNARAIRCYQKSGFTTVKTLSAHELHEGVWGDCLLMECVR